MEDMTKDVVRRAIEECGRRYGFDASEACRELGVDMVTVDGKKDKKEKKEKDVSVSSSFPLPYNGSMKSECCHGLKQNHGLYTQCQQVLKGDATYCKGCNTQAEKNEHGEPDYGSIESRMAVGIFEYVDPKGKKPTAYTKIMKKYKVSEEQVVAEAVKFNLTIDAGHFEFGAESKRGRPKTAVEKPVKGVKGRPKKSKKVVELCEDNTEDLFASLVASANKEAVSDSEVEQAPVIDDKQAKEADKLAKAEAKEQEKAAKLAAKELEKQAKEAEKLAKEAEKQAKSAAKEAEKLAKAAAKEAKSAAKEAKPVVKATDAKESTENQEPDKVKRFEFEGVKYLKSKNTGIIYNMEQEVVGKWNEQSNKIDFKEAEDEEEEEEYDE